MRDWVADEIEAWRDFLHFVDEHSTIPWRLQVGKLLDNADGDVTRAIQVAKYQMNEEYKRPDGAKPETSEVLYWQNAIEYMTKHLVNDIILGE